MTTPSPENIDDDFSKATAAFLSARETLRRREEEIADLAMKMMAEARNDHEEAAGILKSIFRAKENSLPKCQMGFDGGSLTTTDVFILSSANDPEHGQTLTILRPPSKNYDDILIEVYVWDGHCFLDRDIGYLKLTNVPSEFIPKPTEPTAAASSKKPALR